MLAQHSRRSTPLAHALDPLLHFSGRDENLVTETPFSRPLFSSTSALFHFPYPVSPAFATLTKTAGCIPTIPTLERISFRPPAPSPTLYPLFPFFSYFCALFCTYQNHNPFIFMRFRTLCAK